MFSPIRIISPFFLFQLMVTSFFSEAHAYNGSEAWLHYSPVKGEQTAGYSSICQYLVLSDPESDTLKNAKMELELGIHGLLGRTLATGSTEQTGSIVLAPKGSELVGSAGIDYNAINSEGFIIKSSGGTTYITGKNEVGVLRGVFHFLRLMQTGKDISNLDIKESPYFAYRVLDHWWNHYGSNPTVERIYGGDRVYKMEHFGRLNEIDNETEKEAIITYCRMAASLGFNGITPDGKNTTIMNSQNWKCLQDVNIHNLQVFAAILGTYGLKTFLSVSYDSPRRVGGLSSSSPTNTAVIDWWADKVDEIYGYIPNFGGFLITIDAENEFGPTAGMNQSFAARPIAEALAQHGGTLIWRTQVYSSRYDADFAVNKMKTYYNQTWHPNIILRMKDGPCDFQVVEPPNFLTTYGGIRHGMEFQITQEYTGHDKHICWLIPKWKQLLEWNMKGAALREGVEGNTIRHILKADNTWENGGGVWGISNLSDAENWTGHYMHQANAYGFGRLAWNPLLTEDLIADEWIRCSFAQGNNPVVRYVISDILKKSWKTYEDYTISYSALKPAICWNDHYNIEFDKDIAGFRTRYYMNLQSDGIGVDRKPGGSSPSTSTFPDFIPSELADSLCNIETCPEDYLLFFHHCKWEYVMKSGMTLIQSLHYNHFRGIRQVQKFINNWKLLQNIIDTDIYLHVLTKLEKQLDDASKWANTFRQQFGSRYSKAVGCDLEIVVPNNDEAVTMGAGGSIALSSRFSDQKGNDVEETINWRVSGGSLDTTSGPRVTFSAADAGAYTVTASTATFPDLNDQLQIFVGNFANALDDTKKNGSYNYDSKKKITGTMTFGYSPDFITISTPFAGTIDFYELNGRVIRSMSIPSPGLHLCKIDNISKGLYLLQLRGVTEKITQKIVIKN